jgi:hypothetical protein
MTTFAHNRRAEIYSIVGIVIVLITLSFLEYRVLCIMHSAYLTQNAEATISPLTGHAGWRAWQNRLLVAFIMNSIQGNIERAYEISTFVFCIAANVTTFYLYSKNGVSKAMLYVTISVLAFVLIQDYRFLYGWDLPDAIFFTALLIGIDRKWGAAYYTALFAVAFLNRESSFFVPAWMFMDAISKRRFGLVAYSVALSVVGMAGVYFLREHFFITSYHSYVGSDTVHSTFANQFWLQENVLNFFHTWSPWSRWMPSIDLIPAMMLSAVGYFVWKWWSLSGNEKNIVLLCSLMVATIFCFSVIHETRAWLMLIPFLVYLSEETFESKKSLQR